MKYFLLISLSFFASCYSPPDNFKTKQPALTGKILPATFEGKFAMVTDVAKYGKSLQVIIDRADSIIQGYTILLDKKDTTEFSAILTTTVPYDSTYESNKKDVPDSNLIDKISTVVQSGWGSLEYYFQNGTTGFVYSAGCWRTK